jgi:trimethylamine:corrinoid methyltransferase-like protein
MLEKGPGEDFLGEEHTVRHMRGEFFEPRLANRDKREAMGQAYRTRAYQNARMNESGQPR